MRSTPHPADLPLLPGRAFVDRDDVDAVAAVLLDPHAEHGAARAGFEQGLVQLTGAPHALAVVNASVALQLAYHVLGVGPGRTVLTTANAFPSVATAAQLCGGGVEFVDVDLGTGNLDVRLLEERLARGPAPAVVTAVHFAGLPCDMEWLLALKRRHDFFLVEDASQALGARYRVDGRWMRAGEHPGIDATVLSFRPSEHLSAGEGGALLTHDPARAARLRRLAEHGMERETAFEPFGPTEHAPGSAWYRPVVELGYHALLGDLQAALGTSQLRKLPEFLAARREIALRYLAELRDLVLPHPGGWGEGADREHAWQRFVVRTAANERDTLLTWLRRRGIHARVHHAPLPLHPWFRERGGEACFPRAIEHARTALSLPLFPALSDQDQGRVIAALGDWSRERLVA